jgi:nuclear transport factor 2 (NTF2) superfamily protein
VNQFILGNLEYSEILNFSKTMLSNSLPIEKLQEILSISDCPIEPQPFENMKGNLVRKSFRNWTNTEDSRLLAGMLKYGSESWTSISKYVGNNRTRSQCSQRWNRGLNPRISKVVWCQDEDRFLISLVQRYGEKSWTRISSSMRSRSDVQCRYRYYQITKLQSPQSSDALNELLKISQVINSKKKKVSMISRGSILPPNHVSVFSHPVFAPSVLLHPVLTPPVLPPPALHPPVSSLICSQYNPMLYSVF